MGKCYFKDIDIVFTPTTYSHNLAFSHKKNVDIHRRPKTGFTSEEKKREKLCLKMIFPSNYAHITFRQDGMNMVFMKELSFSILPFFSGRGYFVKLHIGDRTLNDFSLRCVLLSSFFL